MSTVSKAEVGDRAEVYLIGSGKITKIRLDDSGREIYSILLDDPTDSANPIYYARREEFYTY